MAPDTHGPYPTTHEAQVSLSGGSLAAVSRPGRYRRGLRIIKPSDRRHVHRFHLLSLSTRFITIGLESGSDDHANGHRTSDLDDG